MENYPTISYPNRYLTRPLDFLSVEFSLLISIIKTQINLDYIFKKTEVYLMMISLVRYASRLILSLMSLAMFGTIHLRSDIKQLYLQSFCSIRVCGFDYLRTKKQGKTTNIKGTNNVILT